MRSDFAVFIMVYGRPQKMWTYRYLRHHGYTGKIYLVGDDLDKTIEDYKKKYGDELIVFDKKKAALSCDAGDNSGDYRSTLFAANTIFELAKDKNIKNFMIMCDDYYWFGYNFDEKYNYNPVSIYNLDKVFDALLDFYENTPVTTIAMSQGGDFIGGEDSGSAKNPKVKRKAMNSFLCCVDRPFCFMGRLNEDVTTYINLGNKGLLFFTVTNVRIDQKDTQSQADGLTGVYIDNGTYVKSFFSVMYNPSCVKVATMGSKYKRIHHAVSWNNAVPCIIRENYRKVA
jgi:hypothetical protein